MTKKSIAVAVFTAILSAAALFPAYGAVKDITSVTLSLSWDKAPKGGDVVGDVYASSSSQQFTIEGADYLERDDTWIYGTRPSAEVELSANDGFRFTSASKSLFSLSGCGAEYKSASIDSDGSTLILQVYFPTIEGRLPATTSTSWNSTTAQWDAIEGSSGYEIKLTKDGTLSATVKSSVPSYDFSGYTDNEGSYTFAVRVLGSSSTQSSPWTADSEPYVVNQQDAWFNADGNWKRVPSGWRFVYKNGDYPTDSWRLINDKWYYFNHKGYMVSNSYVKSSNEDLYYWLDSDGIWIPEQNTNKPDTEKGIILQ